MTETPDAGNYLIILEIASPAETVVGKLGPLSFEKGFYVYAGSARKNLPARVARHLRREKIKRWHLDYLTPLAATIEALPIASDSNIECLLAAELEKLGGRAVPRFGCSDCDCAKHGRSHLYYFREDEFSTAHLTNQLKTSRLSPCT